MSDSQIVPLLLTFLMESLALRGEPWVPEHTLISQIASFIAVVSDQQKSVSPLIRPIPAQAKIAYVGTVNRLCGTIRIVLQELLKDRYIEKMEVDVPGGILASSMKNHYRVNVRHAYVKHFAEHLGCALEHVSHPAYALENSLLETMKRLQISERNPLLPHVQAPAPVAVQAPAPGSLSPITHVFACKSEDRDIWYNIYRHHCGKMTCTCPNFHHVRSKTGEPCKHIASLPRDFGGDGDYVKVGEYRLEDHEPRMLFNKQIDAGLFTEVTQFVGRFQYAELE